VEKPIVKTEIPPSLSTYEPLTLDAKEVSFWFDDLCVFTALSLRASSRDVLFLSGCNGSGKSTLLSILSGLITPHSGSVRLIRNHPTPKDEPLLLETLPFWCFLAGPQHGLKKSLTLEENLIFSDICFQNPPLNQSGRISAALSAVGLENISKTLKTYHLSSGQKQRLSLARLFLCHRPVWLLDEPTTGLDQASCDRLRKAIQTHRERGGITIIATHDLPEEIAQKPFTVLNLNDHQYTFPPHTFTPPDSLGENL
jgi:heme exporter protein A